MKKYKLVLGKKRSIDYSAKGDVHGAIEFVGLIERLRLKEFHKNLREREF